MLRRMLCVFFCFFLTVCLFGSCLPASAAENPAHGTITVATVNAAVGDTVIVPVYIKNNPGIMAITISITYDKEALSYVSYDRGDYLKDYTVADHADKGLVRFVNCETKDRKAWKCRFCENVFVDDQPPKTCPNENCQRSGSYENNAIMASFHFRVKDTASFDLHPISVDYKVGDFSNWNLEKLEPVIVSGGVNVAFNGSNCKHKQFGDWETVSSPGCTSAGKKQRNCKKCGHVEIEDIPAVGHTYEETWTIDRPATKDQSGVMSRHCIRCKAYTDLLTFSLEQSEQEDIENRENTEVSKNGFVNELIKEQIPDYGQDTQKQNQTESRQSQTTQPEKDNQTTSKKSVTSSRGTGKTPGGKTTSSGKSDPAGRTVDTSSKEIEKPSSKTGKTVTSSPANSSGPDRSSDTTTSEVSGDAGTPSSSETASAEEKNPSSGQKNDPKPKVPDSSPEKEAEDTQNPADETEDTAEHKGSPSEALLDLLPDAKQFFLSTCGILYLLLRIFLF